MIRVAADHVFEFPSAYPTPSITYTGGTLGEVFYPANILWLDKGKIVGTSATHAMVLHLRTQIKALTGKNPYKVAAYIWHLKGYPGPAGGETRGRPIHYATRLRYEITFLDEQDWHIAKSIVCATYKESKSAQRGDLVVMPFELENLAANKRPQRSAFVGDEVSTIMYSND